MSTDFVETTPTPTCNRNSSNGQRKPAGYFDELVQARHMLDSRYDEIKSCKVNLIPGDEVEAELRQRIAGRRSPRT